MPHTLTDSPSFDLVSIPNGNEPRTISSLEPGFQALANRTAFAKNLLDTGVKKIRTFQNSGQILGFASPVDGEHAVLIDKGLYRYDASSTVAATNVFVIQPTAVTGPGRWIHVDAGLAGLAGGLATLDGLGRVPVNQLALAAVLDPDGRISPSQTRGSAKATDKYSRTTDQNGTLASGDSYQYLYGDSTTADILSVPSIVVGDILLASATVLLVGLSTNVMTLGLQVGTPGGITSSFPAGAEQSVVNPSAGFVTASMSLQFVATEAGTHRLSLFIKGTSGDTYLTKKALIRYTRLGGV